MINFNDLDTFEKLLHYSEELIYNRVNFSSNFSSLFFLLFFFFLSFLLFRKLLLYASHARRIERQKIHPPPPAPRRKSRYVDQWSAAENEKAGSNRSADSGSCALHPTSVEYSIARPLLAEPTTSPFRTRFPTFALFSLLG